MSKVLITGVSGFIGAHVLQQTLDAGFAVRATARPPKVAVLQELYQKLYPGKKIEVVAVEDVTTGDYTDAFKDVGSIIHVAATLAGKADQAGVMNGSIEGALNIMRQAAKAGIKKIVFTSSIASVMNNDIKGQAVSNYKFTDKDWNPATKEQALDGKHDDFYVYVAAKALAEREVWKFAAEHPDIDITTINPVFVYGPFSPGQVIMKGDYGALGTNGLFYTSLLPTQKTKLAPIQSAISPITVDVRDVAKAHVLALKSTAKFDGNKRILTAGPHFTWKDAVIHLSAVKPELKARLPDASEVIDHPIAEVDTTLAKELLGLNEWIDWKKTVDDTVDGLLELERQWAA